MVGLFYVIVKSSFPALVTTLAPSHTVTAQVVTHQHAASRIMFSLLMSITSSKGTKHPLPVNQVMPKFMIYNMVVATCGL